MRIASAKQFLQENPTETIACAARIFKLAISILHDLIKHDKDETRMSQRGGHNKVLQKQKVEALHEFIRSLLSYGIPPTHELVFGAILALKMAERDSSSSRF